MKVVAEGITQKMLEQPGRVSYQDKMMYVSACIMSHRNVTQVGRVTKAQPYANAMEQRGPDGGAEESKATRTESTTRTWSWRTDKLRMSGGGGKGGKGKGRTKRKMGMDIGAKELGKDLESGAKELEAGGQVDEEENKAARTDKYNYAKGDAGTATKWGRPRANAGARRQNIRGR